MGTLTDRERAIIKNVVFHIVPVRILDYKKVLADDSNNSCLDLLIKVYLCSEDVLRDLVLSVLVETYELHADFVEVYNFVKECVHCEVMECKND